MLTADSELKKLLWNTYKQLDCSAVIRLDSPLKVLILAGLHVVCEDVIEGWPSVRQIENWTSTINSGYRLTNLDLPGQIMIYAYQLFVGPWREYMEEERIMLPPQRPKTAA